MQWNLRVVNWHIQLCAHVHCNFENCVLIRAGRNSGRLIIIVFVLPALVEVHPFLTNLMVYVVTFYSTCSNLFVASRINLFIFRRPCFIHAVLLRPFVFILLTIYHFSIWIICIRLAFLTSSTTSLPSRISGILYFILCCIRVIILLSVLVISDFFSVSS